MRKIGRSVLCPAVEPPPPEPVPSWTHQPPLHCGNVPPNRDVGIPRPMRSWSLVSSRQDRGSACQIQRPGSHQTRGPEESSYSEAYLGGPCLFSFAWGWWARGMAQAMAFPGSANIIGLGL